MATIVAPRQKAFRAVDRLFWAEEHVADAAARGREPETSTAGGGNGAWFAKSQNHDVVGYFMANVLMVPGGKPAVEERWEGAYAETPGSFRDAVAMIRASTDAEQHVQIRLWNAWLQELNRRMTTEFAGAAPKFRYISFDGETLQDAVPTEPAVPPTEPDVPPTEPDVPPPKPAVSPPEPDVPSMEEDPVVVYYNETYRPIVDRINQVENKLPKGDAKESIFEILENAEDIFRFSADNDANITLMLDRLAAVRDALTNWYEKYEQSLPLGVAETVYDIVSDLAE